jgi:hypothetical protein
MRLRVEVDAVEAFFDKYYEDDFSYGKAPGDASSYTAGRIGEHNVAPAYMPGTGRASSASVAASFRSSFYGIKLGIIVGVCGGGSNKHRRPKRDSSRRRHHQHWTDTVRLWPTVLKWGGQ